ncbi:right-handed parallel beta-helix repeat-containing protein [Haladaptatus sp.]|uniref:right-handed parallel beta-helix repeat-containing protein n=1 Tax=Haladaptatus sp. TaxID=1973141 RepID=UPI003C441CB3
MKGVSAAGLCAIGARTMSGRASAQIPYADDYDTVVNLVEDGGSDPNNGDSITPVLREYADDDTLLYLPSGRYYMDEQFRHTGFDNFGIVGEDDTTIVPANYFDFNDRDWNYRLFRLGISYNPGRDLRVENLNIDQTADDTGIRVIEAAVDDGLLVRDIDIKGKHDSGTWGPGRFVITDSNGTGVVERFHAPDGGAWEKNTPGDRLWRGPTGIICNHYNRGRMTFKDCSLGGFPDNGLYAANGSGKIVIDGGHYENSQTASLRIGGEDSIIKNATVSVNESDGKSNQHAIRVENTNYIRIVDCDVEVTDPNGHAIKSMDVGLLSVDGSTVRTAGDGVVHALVVHGRTDKARIKNSTFVHDADGGFSIWIHDGDDQVLVENSKFTGDGGHVSARAAIRCDRDDCEFRNLDVEQTGSSRRRSLEITSGDCLVYDGSYIGEMTPIIDAGSSTWIQSIYSEAVNGSAGLRLTDSSRDVYIKKNTIVNGIDDRGSYGLAGWGNDFSA